ncbi:EamA family transporter [Thalassobacter stenotrophicus]|uniref:EamA-like transporter family protein n=2 Tax=Thalassobacter stenotrophicus TaxID=266809 RepID=A0ABY1I009_9RHOB|nr:EamA family transporter [Thalassobacter stenotrophicus]PVZ48814.1 multidrug transporter [Thalassobacter stenotrophicus]CUH62218.1 phosphonate utilization associated putative membrane protein [Thalassobacter stenotrophicus]SHI32270.1 EamA-like transporter family protein [Thalassobacter stenotrophicus DSM 16310]
MSAWILAVEGTSAGEQVALLLVLFAALLHAIFGAMQKGRFDPWTTRAAIDVCLVLISVPFALFVVPWPHGQEWWLFAGALVIHFLYKSGMAAAYQRGAFTVVYPVVRGTAPLFAVFGAWLIFGETFAPLQWFGLGCLLAGIFGLALYNILYLVKDRGSLLPALGMAVFTGMMVAAYTTFDAFAIRTTPNPFTFVVWFFFLCSLDFPVLWVWLHARGRVATPEWRPLFTRGVIGAFVAYGSFGSVLLATRLGKVGEAAALRETSIVFAALIGWLILKDTVGPRRIALMCLIALGAVFIELGS